MQFSYFILLSQFHLHSCICECVFNYLQFYQLHGVRYSPPESKYSSVSIPQESFLLSFITTPASFLVPLPSPLICSPFQKSYHFKYSIGINEIIQCVTFGYWLFVFGQIPGDSPKSLCVSSLFIFISV